ncbi:MAG: adenylate/guanylate cyclase domain-containing protein [Lachnospiraceae bacterium]|nr:adenylate/guanylate cyclase domain-containing protein [Lachnospiraceae bacterium]
MTDNTENTQVSTEVEVKVETESKKELKSNGNGGMSFSGKLISFFRKNWYIRLAVAAVAALITFACVKFPWLDSLDNDVMDAMFQHNQTADLPIYVIGIDDSTMNTYNASPQTNPALYRKLYGELIETLISQEGYSPAAIALDIIFTGESNIPENDKILVDACKKAGNVVVCAEIEFKDEIDINNEGVKYVDHTAIKGVSYPFDALFDVVKLGFSNNERDTDGVVRTMLTTLDVNDGRTGKLDSLALTTYKLYCDKNGLPYPDFSGRNSNKFRFSYTGEPGVIQVFSFVDVLSGKRDVRELAGAMVFVGGYATGQEDYFQVPVYSKGKMHGVEIHANIVEAIDENKLQLDIMKTPIALSYAFIIFAITYLALGFESLLYSGILIVATVIAHLITTIVLYNNNLYMRYTVLPLILVIIYLTQIVRHYLIARKDKKKISNAFKKYVAPQIVDEVAKGGNYELHLGGEKKHIAVLFVDIRGFTPMSESLQPEQVVEILNEYLALTTKSIFKNKGTLDKFIGDATMAVFNSPFDLDDYIFRAVCTAWDIAAGSEYIEKTFIERFGRTVSYGIGVNCGDAVVGNIGCDFRMDYTAIGDTVNTAARLEANAKAGQILISDNVFKEVRDRVDVEPIGEIPLKGKSVGIFVWRVMYVYRDGEVKPDERYNSKSELSMEEQEENVANSVHKTYSRL